MLEYPARWKNEGDCYSISFIDMDIVTQGKTMSELVEMAEDALSETIAYMYEIDRKIPEPSRVAGNNILHIKVSPRTALPVLIRKARKDLDLSQKEIAKKLKIPYTSYQRWEKINKFNPTIATLEKISRVLGRELIIDLK